MKYLSWGTSLAKYSPQITTSMYHKPVGQQPGEPMLKLADQILFRIQPELRHISKDFRSPIRRPFFSLFLKRVCRSVGYGIDHVEIAFIRIGWQPKSCRVDHPFGPIWLTEFKAVQFSDKGRDASSQIGSLSRAAD